MTFWWVLGGMLVLVGAVVLRDKSTRHKVLRGVARRWDMGKTRSAKGKARAHLRQQRPSAKRLPQAQRPYQRPARSRLRPTKCSAACRTSRKPAFDKDGNLKCDCPCGGREHGMYRKGSTTQTRVATRTTVGTSGTKRPAAAPNTPKPAAPARPAARVPDMKGPVKRATTGTLDASRRPSAPPVQPVSKAASPPPPKRWNGLQVKSWEAMKAHADANPRCAGGTFSAKTYRDRRTDPPKVTQEMSCDTCGKVI